MKKRDWAFTLAAAASGALSAWAVTRYLRERNDKLAALKQGSQMISTRRGPIEAVVVGEGPAVLVLHGGGGGYDMGRLFSYPEAGFKFISVSRPGYLGTPLESGASMAEQANLFAALLDELGVEKVAVIGLSAGGPPALEFALRHTKRCWGLVMISAINAPMPDFKIPLNVPLPVWHLVDFLAWSMSKAPLLPIVGGPSLAAQRAMSPETRQRLQDLLETIIPLSPRIAGVINDFVQANAIKGYPFEEIDLPTLVIHGTGETLVKIEHGERSANRIPGAKSLFIPGGDHMCFITHAAQTEPALLDFLKENAPA